MPELKALTHELFAQCLGDVFRIRLESGQDLDLGLVEATARPAPGNSPRERAFTLLFKSEESGYLPQATYPLQHDRLGSLQVFLVPMGPDQDGQGMCYEAVFN